MGRYLPFLPLKHTDKCNNLLCHGSNVKILLAKNEVVKIYDINGGS